MNLSTQYMGLNLKNPLIASSSTLTGSSEQVVKLEQAGVGAVVLKSLFEEEIMGEAASIIDSGGAANADTSSEEYISYYIKQNSVNNYLDLVRSAKKSLSIPVIASINCLSAGSWIDFAEKIETAGADGLEVNIFILPSRTDSKKSDLERVYMEIARKVCAAVKIPVSIKLSPYFTNLASMFSDLSETGIKSLVLFNRFYNPDIDLSSISLKSSSVFSSPADIAMPLRWIAILHGKVKCDLAASTGVHDGDSLIKLLLVGAKAAGIASALYMHGPGIVPTILDRLSAWMKEKGFNSIDDFRGRLSQANVADPSTFERAQFMKNFSRYGK